MKTDHTTCLSFFWKALRILICLPVFFYISASLASPYENNGLQRIYGPLYLPPEQVDGVEVPENEEDFTEKLRTLLPDLVLGSTEDVPATSLYLKFPSLSDISRIFSTLQKLDPGNIQCDTAALLTAYFVKNKLLSIPDLYQFLVARATITDDPWISITHPYHTFYVKMISRLGTREYNTKGLTLDRILPDKGDQAIIILDDHIGVIKRIGDTSYITSAWGDEGTFLQEITYDSKEEFNHEVWGEMKIESYMKLTQSAGVLKRSAHSSRKKRSCCSCLKAGVCTVVGTMCHAGKKTLEYIFDTQHVMDHEADY